MGTRGPVPKRSDERIRRNVDEVPVDKVAAIGTVAVPELGLADPHPMVADFWQSLVDSAQSRFYEPSDWQFARWTLFWMDGQLKTGKPSAVMVQTINSALSDLLVTEGERRRVRLEIERGDSAEVAEVTSIEDYFKRRFAD